jgi:mscS mechanosensitive ion channel
MNQEEKTNINETQHAVRPHHKQKRLIDNNDDMLKYRNILNIIFMVLAIVGVIVYTQTNYKTTATIILIVAVVLKFIEVALRMFHK